MKRLVAILSFIGIMTASFAQQRPMQSLYMFDPLLINPAYAGNHVQLSATSIYRNQWVNFPGSPKTITATIHSGFKKSRVGVGIIAGRDVIGVHGENSLYAAYSYKIPLDRYSNNMISFGVQGGFNNLVSDWTKTDPHDSGDPNFQIQRNWSWNFGGGIYLRMNNFYAGISVPYGLQNVVANIKDIGSVVQQERYYYLTAGFTHEVSPSVKLLPSTLIRFQNQAPLSFDANLVAVFYDAVGFGVSYRLGDSIVGLFELQINDNFHVGYAYDFTTSALEKFSSGTHEIMVNYRIKIKKIHSGLECPTYW